jgi:hypothetical protein
MVSRYFWPVVTALMMLASGIAILRDTPLTMLTRKEKALRASAHLPRSYKILKIKRS